MALYFGGVLVAFLAAAAGVCLCSLARRARIEERESALSAQALYERGRLEAGGGAAARRGPLSAALREAGASVSATMWLAGVAAASSVAAAFSWAVFGGVAAAAVAVAACLAAAWCWVSVRRGRRRDALNLQFVRILPQVSAGVKSSLTLERAVKAAASHAEDPLRSELAGVLAEAAYGSTLSEAFEGMAQRTGSADVAALASAMRIQQRFGGPIAPVIDLVADHANARMRAARELKTELAGTRLAKWFVAGSMPAIFLIMFASNADFARFYREEPLGWVLLGAAVLMEAVGLTACHRITSFGQGDAKGARS